MAPGRLGHLRRVLRGGRRDVLQCGLGLLRRVLLLLEVLLEEPDDIVTVHRGRLDDQALVPPDGDSDRPRTSDDMSMSSRAFPVAMRGE